MEQIFIPSKNRLNNCSFIKLLAQHNIFATVVVEQPDIAGYTAAFPKMDFLQLPHHDRGIAYVRNFIKEYTEFKGIKKYWMFDDDVTNLYRRDGTKMIKMEPDWVMNQAEAQFAKHPNVGIAALEYQQLAWAATKDQVTNSFTDVAVFINNELTQGLRYRDYVQGKEDRDFAMQVIKSGRETMRSTLYAFAAPKNGSNAGGLKEIFYDLNGREALCADRMVELWGPNVCARITKDDGRPDVKIYWKKINSNQTTLEL